jgi:queuine tRNA-ribosyltransferase
VHNRRFGPLSLGFRLPSFASAFPSATFTAMNPTGFGFTLGTTDGSARAGRMETPHGAALTPAFMPVGTQGTVKAMTPEEIREAGADIILANAYHLYLRPGHETVARLGGLHHMMHWDGPILTDSGGFQVHSLATLRKITDDGVEFQSHIDGSRHFLTPERVIEIQETLGADVIMCFDDCASYPAIPDRVREAVERTISWARRCKQAHQGDAQALFGIIQGGEYREMRTRCAEELVAMDFPGYALGGLSLGESKQILWEAVEETVPLFPEDRPRYLMGVGTPGDFFDAVERGIDLFDCVMPTRAARNALLFTSRGRLQMRRADLKEDPSPPDPDCMCYTCQNYSKGYLRHLFVAKEILAARLATIHNLSFFLQLIRRIREAIEAGELASFRRNFEERYDDSNSQASTP